MEISALTRSVVKSNHAIIAPDGYINSSVPGWNNCTTNVIINEVDSDTPGADTAEFVELYDGGVGNTSLNGLVVVFYNGSNDLSYAAFNLTGSTDANGAAIRALADAWRRPANPVPLTLTLGSAAQKLTLGALARRAHRAGLRRPDSGPRARRRSGGLRRRRPSGCRRTG